MPLLSEAFGKVLKMLKMKTVLGGLAVSALSTGLLVGCGGSSSDDDSGGGSSSTVQNYSGPGSKWDVTLNTDSTFVITYRESHTADVGMTVNGTYVRNSSGFVTLTVSSSTGEDGPSAGDMAWALEVPGYAFMLKPMDDDSGQMIAMVESGSCPTADFDANWVIVKKSSDDNADSTERDFFGTFSYDADSDSATLPSSFSLAGDFAQQEQGTVPDGTCSDGLMDMQEAVMYLTTNGGALVHTGIDDEEDSSIIFALAQSAISSFSTIDGNYAGMLFDDGMTDGSKINPVSMSCTDGSCVGTLVTDVANGTTSDDSVTISFDAQSIDTLATGFITGTITSDGTGNLACMVDDNAAGSGKTIVSCVGQSPGDNSKMFNVMFVSI